MLKMEISKVISSDVNDLNLDSNTDDDDDSMIEDESVPYSSAQVPFRRGLSKISTLPHRLVGVIDEGTSKVAFSIYTTPDFKEIASYSIEMPLINPKEGWFEQDPMAIINNVYLCAEIAVNKLSDLGFSKSDIVSIGITNQRETTVAWDADTGKPLCNAIIWNDIRTATIVDHILARLPDESKNHFKSICGLPISPYFSALKMRWMLENVDLVRKAYREKRCKFGTIDSWIVWNLTKGSLHITDVTNASRTMLMNIETLEWDPILLKRLGIRHDMLPEIRSCSEIYSHIKDENCILYGIRISAILGNQQASLLGQMCINPGQTKNTYRSGCFILCNTGTKPIISQRGLLTTVAYKLGPKIQAVYAFEGAVAVAGHALEWLEKKVRILPNVSDADKYAEQVPTTGDVYFVPAFTGLYAPYWRKDARGIIIGLTQFSTKYHIVRAALESICFQTRDILECMYHESNCAVNKLYADGPLSSNNVLMQLQADTTGVPVFRSQLVDTTAFGAAMCAAQAEGIELCKFDPEKRYYDHIFYDVFLPSTTEIERKLRYSKWKKAVERSFDWIIRPKSKVMSDETYRILSSIPGTLYLFISFGMFIHASLYAK